MTQVERDNAAEVLGNMLSDIADNKLYGIKRDEINAILRSIIVLRDYKLKPAQPEQVSPTTQLDAQHAKNLMSGALAGTDYADRLRWILSQAERVVHVDTEDRAAVERACKLLKDIDNGFDMMRG